jgi:hypothetical protein
VGDEEKIGCVNFRVLSIGRVFGNLTVQWPFVANAESSQTLNFDPFHRHFQNSDLHLSTMSSRTATTLLRHLPRLSTLTLQTFPPHPPPTDIILSNLFPPTLSHPPLHRRHPLHSLPQTPLPPLHSLPPNPPLPPPTSPPISPAPSSPSQASAP